MHWLGGIVRPTTLITPRRLSDRLGVDLLLASETFQHTGSFKFRATYNLASKVEQNHLITASSGNYGQALAYACKLTGKRCHVVMPSTSAKIKVESVGDYGGIVDLIDVSKISRNERVAQLAAEFPDAYVTSAFDDPYVIEGNSTLALELAACGEKFDAVIAPVGGGGLTSGLVQGFKNVGVGMALIGAEPSMANDAARSFREGRLIANEHEPQTIADGARTASLGKLNWPILKDGLADIVEVSEDGIKQAVKELFLWANLKSEPTGALAVGAVLENRARFEGKRVCCVISGGNVDPEVYRELVL